EGGAEKERALEIDVDDVVPLGPGHLGGRLLQRPAGIVDEQINASECRAGLRDRLGDALLGAQLERDRKELAAAQFRIGDQFGKPVRLDVGDREIVTGTSEGQRGGAADTRRGTGDQGGAGAFAVHDSLEFCGGNAIQVRSCMLRWQASAKATSRMPAAKSE